MDCRPEYRSLSLPDSQYYTTQIRPTYKCNAFKRTNIRVFMNNVSTLKTCDLMMINDQSYGYKSAPSTVYLYMYIKINVDTIRGVHHHGMVANQMTLSLIGMITLSPTYLNVINVRELTSYDHIRVYRPIYVYILTYIYMYTMTKAN